MHKSEHLSYFTGITYGFMDIGILQIFQPPREVSTAMMHNEFIQSQPTDTVRAQHGLMNFSTRRCNEKWQKRNIKYTIKQETSQSA